MALLAVCSRAVEVQYKSCVCSCATLFTLLTAALNLLLPALVAYRSRGLWLKSYTFYEQPKVNFKYQYLFVAETEDLSASIICGDHPLLQLPGDDENCSHFQVIESDNNGDGINDALEFKLELVSAKQKILSFTMLLLLDFELQTSCPLVMQSFAVIDKEFSYPSSGLIYYADVNLKQTVALPCLRNHLDIKYNQSLFDRGTSEGNILDNILINYFNREVTTRLTNIHARTRHGQTSTFDLTAHIRIPEQAVRYKPSLLQELKWAWPQYLSLVIVFYWIFHKIKIYVFKYRLIMAWEVIPWKKHQY